MSIESEFLATLTIALGENYVLGETPAGWRSIAAFAGGTFAGPRIEASILPGSADALLRRCDGAVQPDVRMTLKTDDNAYIWLSYRGIRHGTADVMERIARDEPVSADEYYQRAALFFEASAGGRYDWLNRIVAIAVGRRLPKQMIYDVYEIL